MNTWVTLRRDEAATRPVTDRPPPAAPSAPDRPSPVGEVSEIAYESDGRALYWLTYHLLVVTRRRRPFFSDERIRGRCEELLAAVAADLGCEVIACEVHPASAVLHVKAPPTLSPHQIATRLRRDTAGPLMEEFAELDRSGAVFARQYMVTTVPTPETDCADFASGASAP